MVDENGKIVTGVAGKKYYSHVLRLSLTTYGMIKCIIITDNDTAFTRRSLVQWLYDHNYTSKLDGYTVNANTSYLLDSNKAIAFIDGLWISSAPISDTPNINVYGFKRTFSVADNVITISNNEITGLTAFTLDQDIVNEI